MPRVGNQKRSYQQAAAEAAEAAEAAGEAAGEAAEAAAEATAESTAPAADSWKGDESWSAEPSKAPDAQADTDASAGGSSSWGGYDQQASTGDGYEKSWSSSGGGGSWWKDNQKSSWSGGNDGWKSNDWGNKSKQPWKKRKYTEEEQKWADQGWSKGLSGWKLWSKKDDVEEESQPKQDWDSRQQAQLWVAKDQEEAEKKKASTVPMTPTTQANMSLLKMGQGPLPAPNTPGLHRPAPGTPSRAPRTPGGSVRAPQTPAGVGPGGPVVPRTPNLGASVVPQTPVVGVSNPQTPLPMTAMPQTPRGSSMLPPPATPRPAGAPATPAAAPATSTLETPVLMTGGAVKPGEALPQTPAGLATPPPPGLLEAQRKQEEGARAYEQWQKDMEAQKDAKQKEEEEHERQVFLKKLNNPEPYTPVPGGTAVLPAEGDAIPSTPAGPPPGTPAMPVRSASTPGRAPGLGYVAEKGAEGLHTPGSTPGTPATPATLPGTPGIGPARQPFTPVPQAVPFGGPTASASGSGGAIPRTPAGLPPTPGPGQVGLFRGTGAPPTVPGAGPMTPGMGGRASTGMSGMVPQTPGAPGTPGFAAGNRTPGGGGGGAAANFAFGPGASGLRTPSGRMAPKTPNTAIFGPAPITYKPACWSDGTVMELRYAPRSASDGPDAPKATKEKAKIPMGWNLANLAKAGEKEKDALKKRVPDFNTWKREKRKEVRVTDATRAPTHKQAEPLGVTPNIRYATPSNVPENGVTPALNTKFGVTPNMTAAGGMTPFMGVAAGSQLPGYAASSGVGGVTPAFDGATPMLPKKSVKGEETPFLAMEKGREGPPERTPFGRGQETPMMPMKREEGQSAGEMTPGFPAGAAQAGGITPMVTGGITPQVPAR